MIHSCLEQQKALADWTMTIMTIYYILNCNYNTIVIPYPTWFFETNKPDRNIQQKPNVAFSGTSTNTHQRMVSITHSSCIGCRSSFPVTFPCTSHLPFLLADTHFFHKILRKVYASLWVLPASAYLTTQMLLNTKTD